VVPAMTAVSNPNNKPPNAPTAVAFNSVEFNFIYLPALGYLTWVKATIKRRDFCRENATNPAVSGVRLSSGNTMSVVGPRWFPVMPLTAFAYKNQITGATKFARREVAHGGTSSWREL
jgi:hypothetical protein